jgi:hypothetical protein
LLPPSASPASPKNQIDLVFHLLLPLVDKSALGQCFQPVSLTSITPEAFAKVEEKAEEEDSLFPPKFRRHNLRYWKDLK